MKTCAFFGHRDAYGLDMEKLKAAIRAAIEDEGITTFWCGAKGAFDSAAVGALEQIKREYPHIERLKVYAYMPGEKDPTLERYDGSFLPDGLERVPPRFAIDRRNQWMVAHCDMVIVYIDRDFGGAYRYCQKAVKRGIPFVNLGSFPFSPPREAR